jgi:hypothetical protein
MGKTVFTAEIKKFSSKNLASLDKEYRVELAGMDDAMIELARIEPATLVKVTVEVVE